MENYRVDAHCDTLLGLDKSFIKSDSREGSFYSNDSIAVDIRKMQEANHDLQFMAVFISPIFNPHSSLKMCLHYIDLLNRKVDNNSEYVSLITNYKELKENKSKGKISLLLSLEGGEALTDDIAVLRVLYKLGLRCITLTWNHRNNLADGVGESITNGGLTNFGKEVVKEMNRLGIIIDVSHLSEPGFWDVADLTTKPIIASHSCAYRLCNHKRNLKDHQIRKISELGGVIGVNYYTEFLENDPKKANVKSIVNHIEYIANVGGIESVGLGSDFDGAKTPGDISDISKTYKIKDEMKKRGFSHDDINKVMGNNFVRVIKDIL
ncbi:dipeptidase [Dethiothermospora halolimnae]|uniref:dipeptidase n=1 Tax=Dethiothermospora halolimnae TaxID=3114390 RepID=UPI003CCB819C